VRVWRDIKIIDPEYNVDKVTGISNHLKISDGKTSNLDKNILIENSVNKVNTVNTDPNWYQNQVDLEKKRSLHTFHENINSGKKQR